LNDLILSGGGGLHRTFGSVGAPEWLKEIHQKFVTDEFFKNLSVVLTISAIENSSKIRHR